MNTGIQSILVHLPDHKLQLADAVRRIVRSAHASIEEKIKFGRIHFYSGPHDIAFICVKKENDHIELGFFKATALSDPQHLFEGKGKDIRRIKIRSLETIPAAQITSWAREAAALTIQK